MNTHEPGLPRIPTFTRSAKSAKTSDMFSIKVYYVEASNEIEYCPIEPTRTLPFAASPVFFSSIKKFEKLSECEDGRRVYKLCLKNERDYLPGDTIRIIPRNDSKIVDKILLRLGLEGFTHKPCQIQITGKKQHKHFHRGITTIQNIFLDDVDIQTVPKKIFLKSLMKFTTDLEDVEKLKNVTAANGSTEYSSFVSGNARTLLGLLDEIPSCNPPLELILENLVPLQPRPYSLSSSPHDSLLSITFHVLEHKGLCTGWLETISRENLQVPFYYSAPTTFQIPKNISKPLVLIATGTGIAPFQGYLASLTNTKDVWLLYGCRSEKDHLYKQEHEEYLTKGILSKLTVAYSRSSMDKEYIQYKIKQCEDFVEWVVDKNATLFICGGHVDDICCAIGEVLSECRDLKSDFLLRMKKENRCITESWT